MKSQTVQPTGQVLAAIQRLLDVCQTSRAGLLPAERLQLVRAGQQIKTRVDALVATLIAEADNSDAAMKATRTPLTSWLAQDTRQSGKDAARAVFQAREITANPQVHQEVLAGRVTCDQAKAINKSLQQLPPTVSLEHKHTVEAELVKLAADTDPAGITAQAHQIAERVLGDTDTQERLAQQRRTAWANRSLSLHHDQKGSLHIRGQLPQLEGEQFATLIRAYTQTNRRDLLKANPSHLDATSPQQRAADALINMTNDLLTKKLAPGAGGDRPTILVTLDYHKLQQQLPDHPEADTPKPCPGPESRDEVPSNLDPNTGTGTLGGQPLSAGELRIAACDANIIPAVLGGQSEILDIGRAQRLVTKPIRTALNHRDAGCVFPGCQTPPTNCEAHHIIPWQQGGPTNLNNLVLLCHHHHATIEPDPLHGRTQWQVQIRQTHGLPEFTPPATYRDRTPQLHQRHRTRLRNLKPEGTAEQDCPKEQSRPEKQAAMDEPTSVATPGRTTRAA